MNASEKIKALREARGLSQEALAQIIGVDRTTIVKYESGGSKPTRSLKKLADFFHVTTDELLGRPIPKGEPVTMIPIYGRVVAGDPREPVQDIIGYTPITEHEARQGDYFALKAAGASMEPTFSDGDILVVKKQETVDDGQIAIVLIGDEATVKRVYCDERGVSIIADNAAVFRPRLYTNDEAETLPIRILGRVVKVTRDV